MSYNPPETRDLIRDTLYFMNIKYTYEKIKEPTKHVYMFELDRKNTILIYGPRFMKLNRKTYKSAYELQVAVMREYADLL